MHYGVKDYNSMSEDNAGESKTETLEKKRQGRFHTCSSFIGVLKKAREPGKMSLH